MSNERVNWKSRCQKAEMELDTVKRKLLYKPDETPQTALTAVHFRGVYRGKDADAYWRHDAEGWHVRVSCYAHFGSREVIFRGSYIEPSWLLSIKIMDYKKPGEEPAESEAPRLLSITDFADDTTPSA